MRIVIIANFPYRLDGSKEMGRFLYLGEMLSKRDHHVELIVSDFDHGKKAHRASDSIKQDAYKTKITAVHETGYPDNISLKRLWSHFVWGRNVGHYLETIEKPDVVYCAVPSLTAAVQSAAFCKKENIRFIVDVQDLWPEAFQMAIKNRILQQAFLPFKWYANTIFKQANGVIAVSETYVKRVLGVNKKTDKGLCVFLGNDGQLFDDSKVDGIQKRDETINLAYIGSLSYSYDIPCVIEALDIYKKMQATPNIHFVVMGDGVLRKEFERIAIEKSVDCEFTGFLSYPQMVSRMCQCDIVINPIVKGSPASIINKVGDYALSGLPVINTQESREYRQLVDEYGCGINCECGNAQDVANALVKLSNDIELRKKMGAASRMLGVERFDRRTSYNRIVKEIEEG